MGETTRSATRAELERAAVLLDAHPDYRVTRALPPLNTLALPAPEGKLRQALVIDTETTSLDVATGRIIQIAACPVTFDRRARVVAIGNTKSWLEDPGQPLTPEIAKLTGLSDDDLRGQRIDDAIVTSMIADSSVLIAHNASFDRTWWEKRFPLACEKAWACSMREVDWRGHGYEGRSLGALLNQAGWFNARHRADADVDALVALLTVSLPIGYSVCTEMLLTAAKPTARISATRAPFEVKDKLRQRGYRWCAPERVWQIEVPVATQDVEIAWLAAEAQCPSPTVHRVTWIDRHR